MTIKSYRSAAVLAVALSMSAPALADMAQIGGAEAASAEILQITTLRAPEAGASQLLIPPPPAASPYGPLTALPDSVRGSGGRVAFSEEEQAAIRDFHSMARPFNFKRLAYPGSGNESVGGKVPQTFSRAALEQTVRP